MPITSEQIRAVQQQLTLIQQTSNQILALCRGIVLKIQIAKTFPTLKQEDIDTNLNEAFKIYQDLKLTLKQQIEALP